MKDIKLEMQKSIEDTLYYDKENAIDRVILPFLMSLRSVHLLNSFISYHSRRKTS